MNGIHDVGGMHCFGSVPVDDDAQFHADWERLVLGMVRTTRARGLYNGDEFRHGVERMDPAGYHSSTYFERWLSSLERNLVDTELISTTEIESSFRRLRNRTDGTEVVPERQDPELAAVVREDFERASSFERPGADSRFDEGDVVRVRSIHPEGHTRCPQYVRRATGEIAATHGNYVFPDASAHGEDRAEPLYTVAFTADQLWGPDAETPDDTVSVDLWEPYLQPLEGSDCD